jgi:flagellar biosynthesis/type III secretory pathway M-ring protein FliF/YscJ
LVKGALAGLIVGIVVVLIILALIAFLLYKRQQKKKALGMGTNTVDHTHVSYLLMSIELAKT